MPYFAALKELSSKGSAFAGFKLLRSDEASESSAVDEGGNPLEDANPEATADPESGRGGAEPGEKPIMHWFFFPIAGKAGDQGPANLVAWEATSKTGRATYFFRLLPKEQADQLRDASRAPALIEASIRRLNSALVLLNFHREPIYLSDDSLEIQPRFHRYVIATRKIPELRRLRASFLGRAIHTSPEAWQEQVDKFLAMV